MSRLERMSFSIEKPLRAKLEKILKESRYTNRSEFFRDMIRSKLVEREWKNGKEVLGTLTLIYDHHSTRLSRNLAKIQHNHHTSVLASTHLHVDEHTCAEVIIIKGRADRINKIANQLRGQKGVFHAALSMSSTGKGMA